MKDHEIVVMLEARRRELTKDLERLTEPPAAGASVSFGKRIGDGTTEAVERISTTLTARSIASSLEDVDRALAKLSEGTYGRCDECGRPIPDERLAARPATSDCIECSSGRR